MKRILIIEDSSEILENLEEILTLSDFEVSTANCGDQGIEIALREIPELILCDIAMPGKNGFEVLENLRKNSITLHIPFVIISALTQKPDLERGMKYGADAYLCKPFETSQLLQTIDRLLEKVV